MKIAIVTRRYPPLIGGAEKVLSYLATALAEQGAEVIVLTSAIVDATSLTSPAPSANPRVVRLPTARARFVGTWLYMRNLRRWFERNPIDIAYVSMLKHDAYVAIDAAERLGFRVALRPEGAGATGDLAWQAWGRFGRKIGERCRRADALVALSPAIRGELEGAGYNPSKIHDIPNGVPVPGEPWSPRAEDGSRRAVYVGRLAAEKGLETLVRAWPRVRAEHHESILTLVGDGPERASLESLVAELDQGDAIRLPGASADPGRDLLASDLFVLPSREEGMSVALLEAMAMGVPAVASAIPGNLGLIVDGELGRLFPPGDPQALADAILTRWSDPGRAFRMAEAARRRVEDRYSIEAVARRHIELFERLVREGRGGGTSRC